MSALKNHYHDELEARRAAEDGVCYTCGDTGVTVEFRRFAGEAIAGEPVEVPCPDCDGVEDEPVARAPYVPSAGYTEWLASLEPKHVGGGRYQVAA